MAKRKSVKSDLDKVIDLGMTGIKVGAAVSLTSAALSKIKV